MAQGQPNPNPTQAPYGEWESPITSAAIVTDAVRLGEPRFDGDTIYWLESRPQEQGRSVLMRRTPGGANEEVLPKTVSVRTRVHEYGGGAYAVQNGHIVFTDYADQRIYQQRPGADPQPLTPEADHRFADYTFAGNDRIYAIREDHTAQGEAQNTIVVIELATGQQRIVASGNDFYSNPRVSPDGTRLAWLTWNHPNMPWDGTELWIADIIQDGTTTNPHQIAGGKEESIFQPAWQSDTTLCFTSDRTGWWNLYGWNNGNTTALHPAQAEFGEPQWVFGQSTYAFQAPANIICAHSENGRTQLGRLNTETLQLQTIDTPHTAISALHISGDRAIYLGGSATRETELALLDLTSGEIEIIAKSSPSQFDTAFIPTPESITYPAGQGRNAHAFYYPPANPNFTAPQDTRPPLLVLSHGGPTSATDDTLDPRILFWTSRGFAIVDVNYGGSTGYGRQYRNALRGNWGIVDVEDCVAAAEFLVAQGKADPERLAIRGGSAGGYTTLAALAFRNTFKAGASYYGVADLEILARDTHKFESRYLDSLVGPYPQAKSIYEARSPIHHLEDLDCPVIIFQGLEDTIVPPNQSQMIYDALNKKGIPTAYITFKGEGHGFRQAKNIKQSLDNELYFYGKIFNLSPADNLRHCVEIILSSLY